MTLAATAPGLLELVEEGLGSGEFNEIHLRTAFNKLARLERSVTAEVRESGVLRALVAEAERAMRAGDVGTRTVATVFWSVATLQAKIPWMRDLVPALVGVTDFLSRYFNAQDVANLLWACAKLQLPRSQLEVVLPGLAARAVDRAYDFKPQEVSNVIWSCATLVEEAPELYPVMPAMKDMVLEHGDMGKQETANILWACAKLRHEAPALLEALPVLLDGALRHADRMGEQEVSNSIWAVAALRDCPLLLRALPALIERAEALVGQLASVSIANIFHAATLLGDDVPDVAAHLPRLLEAAEAKAADFSPVELERIVLGTGAARLPINATLRGMRAMQVRALPRLGSFRLINLAKFCWGLSLYGNADARFMKGAVARIVQAAPEACDEHACADLPMIVLAFAKLGMRSRKLMAATVSRLSAVLKDVNAWGICALAWSYREQDSDGRFAEFRQALDSELLRRRIPPARIEASLLGPDAWFEQR